MINDKRLKKLIEAWNDMETTIVPTNEAAPAQMPNLLEELKSIFNIVDNEVEVDIKLGSRDIATLYEDNDGMWVPMVFAHTISATKFDTKEEAFKAVIDYFKDNS